MAWVPLTAVDILNSLSVKEQGLFQDAQSQQNLANITVGVIGLVRGKVNAAKRNQGHLGPEGTIPDELMLAALAIGRFKLISQYPENQLMAPDREQDRIDAYAQLEQVANGELVVVRGDDVGGQTPELQSDFGSEPYFEPYPTAFQPDPLYPL